MTFKMNPNIYPPGGFVFRERDGTMIRAGSWKAVVTRTKAYRKRNVLEVGDVEKEVMDQACAASPDLCQRVNTEAVPVPRTLKSRVFAWLNDWRKEKKNNPVRYVSDAEAERRAKICQGCGFQRAVGGGCSSCAAFLKASRKEILEKVPAQTSVGACAVLNSDLPTAVHLDEIAIRHTELPGHCWRKAQ